MKIYQRFYLNRYNRQQLLERSLLVLFFLSLAYRMYACFQVPLVTTDVLRNLGYASHALENNFTIYNTKAIDFQPEIWSGFWSELTYPYPPVTLLFFHIFSLFNLGVFWVKLALTVMEAIGAYLFYKRISKVAAILYFCAPVSLWYTSHEGQFEALQTLFIILNVLAIQNKRWRFSGFLFSLSVQVKQMGILIAPWMFYKMWKGGSRDEINSRLGKVAQGIFLGFLPFLGYYLQSPDLWLQPLLTIRTLITYTYNPFAWNFRNLKLFGWNPKWLIYWNSFFSYAVLIVLAIAVILILSKRKKTRSEKVEFIVSVVPLASFWFIVKSLKWSQFWYTIISPGFMFCFSQRKNLICLLLVLHLMQGLRSTVLILNKPFGVVNSQQDRALIESCLFTCNVKEI